MVMKNTYVKPEMQVEEFLANQYCSNCKSGEKYLFECNIGTIGTLYEETNGIPGLQTSKTYGTLTCTNTSWRHSHTDACYSSVTAPDTKVPGNFSGYSGCGKKHEADTQGDFVNGYNYRNGNTTKVIIWYSGSDHTSGSNVHVTTATQKESWEIVKS